MDHVVVLLADHVHVRLQHDGRQLLVALRGRLRDQDVASRILFDREVMVSGELL